MNEMKRAIINDLMKGLYVIPKYDRDLRSLSIWCNPNHIHGSDHEVSEIIRLELNRLEKENKIKKSTIKIYSATKKKYSIFEVFSLL